MAAFSRENRSMSADFLLQLVSIPRSSIDLKVRANHIKESMSAHWAVFSAEHNLWLSPDPHAGTGGLTPSADWVKCRFSKNFLESF